jgi:hypothetical protein
MRSKNVFTERTDCLLATSFREFTLIKANPGGHHRVIWVAVYNPDGSNTVSGYLGIRRRGKKIYLAATGTVATTGVKEWTDDFFLTDNDELFVELKTSASVLTAQVLAQSVFFKDG